MEKDLQTKIAEAIANPKNMGEMSSPDAVGTVGSPNCGDMVRMWIKFKEENRKYLYYPVVKKKDFYGVKTESFLNKFFDGELSPLVSFFSSHKKLTTSEIARIRKLLDEQEAGHDE